MNIYLNKGFNSQFMIVKDSLKLMYKFKIDFERLLNNES